MDATYPLNTCTIETQKALIANLYAHTALSTFAAAMNSLDLYFSLFS